MTADATLEVEGLAVERGGRTVLHGASLRIAPGEIVALLGANGAGKSTLVMTVAGTLPALAGSIRIGNVPLEGQPSLARRRLGVAVVAEGHRVLSGLSVRDNLAAAALSLPRPDAEAQVEAMIALFPELRERLDVHANLLSGGQKQMVNIAQALIARPRFLLIDELSLGLAPGIVVRLGETIRTIAGEGVGILLIEQFTTLALSLAARAYVMERGNIVFSGAARDLEEHPEILHGAYLAASAAR
jgi:branched-chain amino acid transport system ATP-binding protein